MSLKGFKICVNVRAFSQVLTWWVLIFSPTAVNAEGLEKLLMPGSVIQGHAKFENECSKCHSLFEKKSQNRLCGDCHKKITRDIELKNGFHGLAPIVIQKNCNDCHTDHEGREADIIRLDREAFDHQLTDFVLKGGHRNVKCRMCHVADKKFREASSTCFDCHKQDDPHRKRLGTACGDCHKEEGWGKAKFDHDKKTKFRLKGSHRNQHCNSCHPNEQYKKTPVTCVGCHALNDIHRGELGEKCGKCHQTVKWKKVGFDHDKKTKFPLKESHAKLKCRDCHYGNPEKEKLKKECISCHKNDDEHKGGFGQKCESCHNSKTWNQIIFNHDRDTKFKLSGSHVKRRCGDCHKGIPKDEKLKSQCYDCHKVDDVHKGQEGKKCDKCHNQNTWREKVKFEHSKTRFPLTGIHNLATCESCHLTTEYKNASTECVDCHLKQDYHRGRMPVKCGKCHNPKGWKDIGFDHDKDTKFLLKGSHKSTDCHLCHVQPVSKEIKLLKTCIGCHQQDDVHKGQQGKKCDKCHNQNTWEKGVKFDHNLTRFPLIGLHSITTCEGCHLSSEFKKIKSTCVDCHLKNDPHKNRLGSGCGLCHTPEGWSLWQFEHQLQSEFPLIGAHEKLDCLLCHTEPLDKKSSMKKTCFGCHEADDIHKGHEGKKCQQCHNERSWREQSSFDHDLTSFPLIGIHAVTGCENCHISAQFKKVESTCISCHGKDDSHKKRMGPHCETCHNPNHWKLWEFNHNSQTRFKLDGAHEGLECLGCHRQEVDSEIELPLICISCHQTDDVHRGKFGRQCSRCHISKSFKEVKVKRWGIN